MKGYKYETKGAGLRNFNIVIVYILVFVLVPIL